MNIISHPIKPEKGKAWHLYMHPYFTKQASNVVAAYIEHYSREGDTVLDPFCGTGVTAMEALRLKRKAAALDLNPLACFITEQTAVRTDTEKLKKVYCHMEEKIGKEIERIDNLSAEKIEAAEIPFWYPKGIRLPKNTDKGYESVEQLWTKRQLIGLSLLWHVISEIQDSNIRNQMKLVFSSTVARVNLTYNISRTRQHGEKPKLGDGGAALFAQYRYWFPKNIVELKVWDRFRDRFSRILKAKEKWNEITRNIDIEQNLRVINASVLDLTKYIPENSVDYIYTDPPYGGNIAYLDLSTMWNAWLGFEVNSSMKENEIIEGGDLDKTQQNYENLFSESFGQMSMVLKKDGWLSLVFAHKKLEFWNLIIDANENNGLEFKGSVYQPTNNSSVHYKKNPANVLCSQRIANFQKTFERSVREKPDDLKKFILNEMERACVEGRGAAIDVIYQRVLDQLLRNNTIHEAKKKGYLKIDQLLENSEDFVLNETTGLYYLKDQEKKYGQFAQEYFRNRNELEIYLKSLLHQKKGMTLDEIHMELFEIYADEKKFPMDRFHKDLDEILNEIARKSPQTGKWQIRKRQTNLEFSHVLTKKLVKVYPGKSTHSEIIFRLVQIGKYLGFSNWIGKREQSTDEFQGARFCEISLPEIPLDFMKDSTGSEKIKQIDCIWFDKLGIPRYAFEVEESTNIMTGFERFRHLLGARHELSRKLFIVAPKSRRRNIADVFRNSSYIGHPLYLENKVGLIFREELVKFYDSHTEEEFEEADFCTVFADMEI